jgi:RNA polymerase sigma-70 factor (ECF subfamily)
MDIRFTGSAGSMTEDGSRPQAHAVPEVSRTQLVAWLEDIGDRRDRQSFEALFRYFSPRLLHYLLRTGSSTGAAEEFVQDTMTEIWLKAHQYDPNRAAPNTWVYTIARNLRIDRQRKLGKRPHSMLYASEQVSRAGLEDDPQIGAAQVLDHVEALSDEQSEVLYLAYLDGLSHSEISRRLRLPLGTVKSRVRLAFNQLRQSLSIES